MRSDDDGDDDDDDDDTVTARARRRVLLAVVAHSRVFYLRMPTSQKYWNRSHRRSHEIPQQRGCRPTSNGVFSENSGRRGGPTVSTSRAPYSAPIDFPSCGVFALMVYDPFEKDSEDESLNVCGHNSVYTPFGTYIPVCIFCDHRRSGVTQTGFLFFRD